MRTLNLTALPRFAAATLLATLLAGCSSETQSLPPEAAPTIAPDPAPAQDLSTPAPDATPAPEAMPPDAAPPADT
ncbi:MAG: hypothetical protein H7Y89_06105, partial [Steroidobacteraceae bacterium]|nr:hypothetical protein [Steroidobacteraceae bacterium]